MNTSTCSTCDRLERRIAALEDIVRKQQATIDELQALNQKLLERVRTNATNSSTPPSANPLDAPKPVKKKKGKRKPGGQPGHPPHPKLLLPPEQVTRTQHLVPDVCDHCQATLPDQPDADGPPPKRFQVIELPPIVLDVTEYQAHARTCPCCGHRTQATIPEDLRAHSVGPNLTATLSYLTGCHGRSKRAVEESVETVFGAPIALGTVANLEQEVSAALAPAHQEAVQAVQAAETKYADETRWKRRGTLCWLWAAATTTVAAFVIHAKRSTLGLVAILGAEISGIVHSDRWHVYHQIPAARRQICWAHLKRDFQ